MNNDCGKRDGAARETSQNSENRASTRSSMGHAEIMPVCKLYKTMKTA
jgi:hypothetical protein